MPYSLPSPPSLPNDPYMPGPPLRRMLRLPPMMPAAALPPSPDLPASGPYPEAAPPEPPPPALDMEAAPALPPPPPITPRQLRLPEPIPELDQYRKTLSQMPQPPEKIHPLRRVLAGALGAGAGLVNASGRTRIPGETVAAGTENILRPGYQNRLQNYLQKLAMQEKAAQMAMSERGMRSQEMARESQARAAEAQEALRRTQERRGRYQVTQHGVMDLDEGGQPVWTPPEKTVQLPDTVAQSLGIPLGTKVPAAELDSYVRILELRGQREDAATLRRELADQAAASRREIAQIGAAARRETRPGGLTDQDMAEAADAVQAGQAKVEDYFGTTRTRLINELNKRGYQRPPALSPAQKEKIGDMATLEKIADKLMKRADKGGNLPGVGPVSGTAGALGAKYFGTGEEDEMDTRAELSNILGTFAKIRGGTAFSDHEKKMLERYVPTQTESSQSVMNKLKNLKAFIAQSRADLLTVSAVRGPQGINEGQQSQASGTATTVRYTSDGKTYNIPVAQETEFLKDHPQARKVQ